jgi:hypothetical protein
MSTIRALERDDLDEVASLFTRVARGGRPAPGLRAWFERVLFDHPWVDDEIPSLVATDADGQVVGFLASHVRRLRLHGEPARLACSGQLVVAPAARRGALGALMLRRYMTGPQDLTTTDGATDTVRAMWELLGGEQASLQCIEWVRPLRPWRLAGAAWERRSARPLARPVAAAAAGLDRATVPAARLLARAGRAAGVSGGPDAAPPRTQPMGGKALVAAVEELTARRQLRPDYDVPFAEWLLTELAAAPGRGTLRTGVVHDDDDALLGFYVYFLKPGGASAVQAIGAATEQAAERVLDAVLADARAGGAAAVHGRLEPRLLVPTRRRRCLLVYHGGALVHARDPAVLALATSRHAHLTRLEGERWMTPQWL